MNDRDLESLLQSLPPAAASPALEQRILHEMELDRQWLLDTPRRSAPRWLGRLAWSAVGAAAAVAALSFPPLNAPNKTSIVAPNPAPSVMPIHTIRELVSTENEGIRFNAVSQLPEQHVKVVSVERHAWIDPRDGAEITVEVPREDSVVLPVSFQ